MLFGNFFEVFRHEPFTVYVFLCLVAIQICFTYRQSKKNWRDWTLQCLKIAVLYGCILVDTNPLLNRCFFIICGVLCGYTLRRDGGRPFELVLVLLFIVVRAVYWTSTHSW